mmetsp:Transcript_25787/g.56887  ORF Transcript_25787/g.56887 Transcript_25787/m.56887 type:complete len:135 (-) Transcript_25787:104-508(-)|eukprot:CAMPEP_0204252372 /NCGR_PEP_ID=MMETSP0468-20130131/1151_1 /ASSEMBLY_ACC=CAM_ASM_000383 /TAXON_ID=2969 /ORGANISM="Oxyrrhis marina" /LENGTH=134 /DNA_ID=CAMNT_0051225797 /DNA_START=52 /DNA_END=456 /DNA_ORIENTATION=+
MADRESVEESAMEVAEAVEVGEVETQGERKKRKKVKKENYKRYILNVLKQIHPKVTISRTAMEILNSIVQDTFEELAQEAQKLCKMTNKPTLASREMQTAIRLVLPGELAKHAVSEGTKALTKFGDPNTAEHGP